MLLDRPHGESGPFRRGTQSHLHTSWWPTPTRATDRSFVYSFRKPSAEPPPQKWIRRHPEHFQPSPSSYTNRLILAIMFQMLTSTHSNEDPFSIETIKPPFEISREGKHQQIACVSCREKKVRKLCDFPLPTGLIPRALHQRANSSWLRKNSFEDETRLCYS